MSLRTHAASESLTPETTPILFVQNMGDEQMTQAQNLFVLWYLGVSDYNWHTKVAQPPKLTAFDVAWKKLAAFGARIWWVLKGIGQLFLVVITAIWSAKVVGICPLVDFVKPTNAEDVAQAA